MADQRNGGIAWTEETWNPIRGCSRISAGCRNCYAETMAGRFSNPGQPYHGYATKLPGQEGRWTGKVSLVGLRKDGTLPLEDPLRWKRPRMVFPNSMSDLFHESLSFEHIAAIFGVMALAPRHTFQPLTKRPLVMLAWFRWVEEMAERFKDLYPNDSIAWRRTEVLKRAAQRAGVDPKFTRGLDAPPEFPWPLPNVWPGVSVEDPRTVDERVGNLLQVPAAMRWVSYEPALAPIMLTPYLCNLGDVFRDRSEPQHPTEKGPFIDWVVAGAESGQGARTAELEWFRAVKSQCAFAGKPFFMKQITGPKGKAIKNIDLFPEDLRVRQFPQMVTDVHEALTIVSEKIDNHFPV